MLILTGNRLEDWYITHRILIAPHEMGHAIRMAGITSDERIDWKNRIYPKLSSQPGFPGNWKNIFPYTYEALRNEVEMFPELTRGIRQDLGSQIRSMDQEDLTPFLLNIYGPF